MNVQISSVSDNPVMERREVELEIDHAGEPTPEREQVKERFAAEHGVEEDEIDVKSVRTPFGSRMSVAKLKVHEQFEYREDLEKEETTDQAQSEEPEAEEQNGDSEEEDETSSDDIDYDDLVSGTISDAKETLEDLDEPDYGAALEAEQSNKDRVTFVEWLEERVQ
nr:MAG: ribosomal protein S24E [Candidatus Nanosalinarum sp. J07AB56]